MSFDDWRPAPNIGQHPDTYERENEALARDGRLDRALAGVADPAGKTLLDVGCGTGFWLSRWPRAERVIGVEPDPDLVVRARARIEALGSPAIEVRPGSAEHLPLEDQSVDLVHARFAYFFGAGSEAGLAEVARVLRPNGTFVAVDNSWTRGEFADLLRDAVGGNASHDPSAIERWWTARGARRIEVRGGWQAQSATELQQILRIEFPSATIDRWVAKNAGRSSLSYAFALYVWAPSAGGHLG